MYEGIKITDIPGAGKKFEFSFDDGGITVVITHDESRFVTVNDDEGHEITVKVKDEDLRKIAAIFIAGDLLF
ncbi:MAG: hypothetical protein M1481_05555 [Candidatus Thermoplasmatota archaeon]|jgi:K+/H+ antiporter YhaU regulatory subunit KhtT|nr:hypothetical protein [Candidatus Thermoplasmatota archaeon]MCL5963795.1 hypothetical protein [Candidatus Thermoplasmatota archaeon]